MQLIILYSLKGGVSREDFHNWVRTIDYPAMRGLARVENFKTFETKKLLMGEGEPSVGYVEIFDIPDFDGFMVEDLGGDTVQGVMGQFMGFADAPEFIICDEVK
ncbi:MAG: REDY-like protein HapK [Robiginitomaculum sp.]|nr:MAG: REDY-like protein HapK [Robiginitomaculum sp.]